MADLARRGPDLVVHGGDLALMGPRPEEVIDLVRALGWPGVVGNTDQLLWRPEEHARQRERAPALQDLLDLLFNVYAPDTRARLGDERVGWLRELPLEYHVGELTVLHAQPGDLWRAPLPDATEEELLAAYSVAGAAQVAYGHVHRPFSRQAGGLRIANAGSVGLPWDGDPRASYLLVTDGLAEVIRVAYDIEAEVAALHAARHPDSERLLQMRRRGRFIRPEPPEAHAAGGSTPPLRYLAMNVERAIRERRTHKVFASEPLPRALLDELLALAQWAPNHHLTNPWRFRVLGPDTLRRLKKAAGPEAAAKLDRAPTLVAVTQARSGDPIQDEEDLCATACATYAVLLAAHGRGLAGYWRTPQVLRTPDGREALGINDDERFVALIHLGWPRQEKAPPERAPRSDVIEYLD